MKAAALLAALLALAVLLGGCRPTTTVILPPDPPSTAPATEKPTLPEESTAPATTAPRAAATEPTEPPTEAATARPSEAPTAPPTTRPPVTRPPETAPPATAPPETQPPETEPALTGVYDISSHSIGALERNILEVLNQRRANANLSPLTMSRKLSALAAIRAYECTQRQSHTRPDGRDYTTVLSDYDFTAWRICKEALLQASQGLSADVLVDTWLNYASTEAAVLGANYSQVGIGIYEHNGLLYLAAIFTDSP